MTRYRKLAAYLIGAGATVAVAMLTHGGATSFIPAALGGFTVWYLKNEGT